MNNWVKIPTDWIRNKDVLLLKKFTWIEPERSSYVVALILYIVIAQHANRTKSVEKKGGFTELSYDKLMDKTGISRAKISDGLNVLLAHNLIEKIRNGRNNKYYIVDYDVVSGWAKLPAKQFYDFKDGQCIPFSKFTLRNKNELNALKIYLLLVAFRDIRRDRAYIKYDNISFYTGMSKSHIKPAISLLINLDLIFVETDERETEAGKQKSNAYQIIGIVSRT